MTRRPILIGVSLVVIALNAVRIVQYVSTRNAPPVYTAGYERLGRVLVDEIAGLMGGEGTLVLVTSGTQAEGMDLLEPARLRAIEEAVGTHKGLSILATEKTAPPADRIDLHEELLAFRDLKRVMERHREVSVIVSLVGEPDLTNKQVASLPTPRPRLICVSAGGSRRLERLVKKGLVELAIVERVGPKRTPPGPLTDAQWFDKYYEVLRSE